MLLAGSIAAVTIAVLRIAIGSYTN